MMLLWLALACEPPERLFVESVGSSFLLDEGEEIEQFEIPAQAVDLLFVVDNSSSMEGRVAALQASMPGLEGFLNDDSLDLHVGVIATDTQSPDFSGRLREVDGYRFVHPGIEENSLEILQEMLGSLGVLPGSVEAGRLALSQALGPANERWNRGFHRRVADLHVIFVSDSNDQSGLLDPPYSRGQFLNFSSQLKPDGQRLFLHGIVVRHGAADGVGVGIDYIEYAELSEGTLADISETEYTELLRNLKLSKPMGGRSFELNNVPPAPEELVIEVFDLAGQSICGEEPCTYSYDPQSNRVYFPDLVLPVPGWVQIEYLLTAGPALPR